MINLIIEVYDKSMQKKQPQGAMNEILDLLPPTGVQKAVLSDLGIIGNIPVATRRDAEQWISNIGVIQTRAEKVIAKLYALESPNESEAKMGSLPGWIVEPWASFLNFAWSYRLPDSLIKAEQYVANREAKLRA